MSLCSFRSKSLIPRAPFTREHSIAMMMPVLMTQAIEKRQVVVQCQGCVRMFGGEEGRLVPKGLRSAGRAGCVLPTAWWCSAGERRLSCIYNRMRCSDWPALPSGLLHRVSEAPHSTRVSCSEVSTQTFVLMAEEVGQCPQMVPV